MPGSALVNLARKDARKYGVPEQVFLRQIQQESGFDPNAVSPVGAKGIAQFMPATAAGFHINPLNPVEALDAAARYDSNLIHKYGTVERALSAYNSGRPDAYQDPNFAHGETFNYVKSILGGKGIGTAGGASGSPLSQLAQHSSGGQIGAGMTPGQIASLLGANQAVGLQSSPMLMQLLASKSAAAPAGAHQTSALPAAAVGLPGAKFLSVAPGASLEGVDPTLVADANALSKELGGGVTVSSGARDFAKQSRLYQRYLASGKNPAYIAAAPGTSNHEPRNGRPAEALDLLYNGVPIGRTPAAKLLARYGLHLSVPGDAPHVTRLGVRG